MLYLVSTPIGNLGDMTYRAVEVLQEVDLIISEDTRKTSILLKKYQISKPQMAFNNFNEKKSVKKITERLVGGENIALVTNAGTPSISDPGYLLVNAAINANIEVTALPGATAVITALILSGLSAHSFIFRGFPPHKQGPRIRFLAADAESPYTKVYYESPYRLLVFLEDAISVFGNRRAVIANDLTKKFEAVERGNLVDLKEKYAQESIRGEYTIVIEGNKDA